MKPAAPVTSHTRGDALSASRVAWYCVRPEEFVSENARKDRTRIKGPGIFHSRAHGSQTDSQLLLLQRFADAGLQPVLRVPHLSVAIVQQICRSRTATPLCNIDQAAHRDCQVHWSNRTADIRA